MKLIQTAVALAIATGLSLPASAERVDHYQGKDSETLSQAVSNFSEYNDKLAKVMEKKELTPTDLNDIHQLTYTLENALEKINSEMTSLADTLESLHVASETGDVEGTRKNGDVYLKTVRELKH